MVTIGNEAAGRVDAASARDDRYYSVAEAAARLGVSRVSIWRWIRAGRLPAAQLGHRTTRINQRDLDRFLTPAAAAGSGELGRTHESLSYDALAPRASWWNVQPSEHFVQFYETDGFLVGAVADYIGAALRAGDAAMVIATSAHRAAIAERLSDHGIDPGSVIASGQYVPLDATATLSTFMVDGLPDEARFQASVGATVEKSLGRWPRLRAFGEMVALLAVDGQQFAAIRLEALWNELQQHHKFSLMCAYPMRDLGGESLAPFVRDVCGEHSRIVPAETYTALDAPDARLRAIALLQQKARSLELEVAAHERTEHELRRREAELRDFLEQGLMGLHWVDAEGTILWANQAELDLLGFDSDEYIGRFVGDFYVDSNVAIDVLAQLTRREPIRECEVQLRRKDGSIKHVLISSNVLWDGDTFVHTRCFTVDITRRKQAEQRLELQYAITQALSDADTLDEAGRTVLRRVSEALGWEAGGLWLVDHPARTLRCHEFWHRPDREFGAFEAVSRGSTLSMGTGLPGRVWSTGQPAWIADIVEDDNFARAPQARTVGLHGGFAFPIRVADDVIGVMEFFSPSSEAPDPETLALMAGLGGQVGQFVERKRAEAAADIERQRLLEVFQQAPAAIAVLHGPEHLFEFVNREYLRTIGRKRAASVIGKSLRETLPELVDQGYIDLLDNVYTTGRPFVGQELRLLMKRVGHDALQESFVNLLLQPSRDATGQIRGILAHGVDVTEQVQARLQLREQIDQHVHLNRELRDVAQDRDRALEHLQRLVTAREEFLAAAAHDLKNPLANMKGQAQLLRRRVLRTETLRPEALLVGLESLDGSATRMAGLIDDLLDVARLELGQSLELQCRPIDLVALVQRAVAEHQQATERHTIRLETSVSSLGGTWDAQRLERALNNLLDNATKYSPAGGEVVVALHHLDDSVVITVSDEGLGIPDADLPHIFERFMRGSNVEGRVGGTGIGLASVRALVESHGGTVSVESTEGRGSRFVVRLPLGADGADSDR